MKPVPRVPQARPMAIDRAMEKAREVYESISRRAFELFQSRKQEHSRDQDDWLRAESELLHTAHLDVEDCDDAIVVRAEVPGFRPDELEVCVEPFRITIAGRRETTASPTIRKILFSDRCSDQVFRVIDLPIELDSKAVPIAVAAYWMLRAEDHQRWAAVFDPVSENGNGNSKLENRTTP
jgi:HSP20 family molecular chaperone IbpA